MAVRAIPLVFIVCFLMAAMSHIGIIHGAFPPIRSLGATDMSYAAFSQILHNSKTGKEDLVVTTFNSFLDTLDIVYVIRDIGKQVALYGGNDLPKEILTQDFYWPNELEVVPNDVLGRDDLWWCGSGFLVPTKEDGNVAFLEVSDNVPSKVYDISSTTNPDRELWWYHRVAFLDMNTDGRKDALASRAYLDDNGDTVAQMVWFEQPSSGDSLTQIWKEHIMFKGPDALFRLERMSAGGRTYDVIISTQYFAERLVISWIEEDGTWTDPSTIQHLEIDAVVDERYFDCQLIDINVDGKEDLLVSVNSDYNGKLVAFDIPDDFREKDKWVRHDIAEGFKPQGLFVTEGNGAPGIAVAFYPMNPAYDGRLKPMILMTGDDDGNVYMFESDNDLDPSVWTYSYESFFYARGTVGAPTVKDVDGDGFMEVFIPAYSDGKLHVYTFKP